MNGVVLRRGSGLLGRLRGLCRLTGAVALLSLWLASTCLTACPNTVLVGKDCAAACEDDHAKGLAAFHDVSAPCACEGCSEACTKEVCWDDQTPSDACLPCVQEALRAGSCDNYGFFQVTCLHSKDCMALIDCIVACPP